MKYAFEEIFPVPTIARICESFTKLENCVTALLDLDGKIHVATGWQDACTKFHRVDARSCAQCLESDTALAGALEQGKAYNLYRCKNGLVDVAVPVVVDGEHVANFFTGQFFLEKPDTQFFKDQAGKFGFDEQAYLEALSKVPVHDEQRVERIMAFIVELTQLIGEMGLERLRQKEAEQEQKRLLEEKVRERTKELEVAKCFAEKANASKSEFLASMSHELRTPLNAIIGFSSMMTTETFGQMLPKYKEYAVDIQDSGQHLLALVNDLLDIARIDAGRLELAMEHTDVAELVEEVVRLSRPISEEKQQRLLVSVPSKMDPLLVDRRAYKQILMNLVTNAQKFTPHGGSISVNLDRRDGKSILQVQDSGVGISEKDLPHVTEVFSRGTDKYLRTKEGWGLGLAITKALIERHDGNLNLESKVGVGTTVTVEIPFPVAETIYSKNQPERTARPTASP